MIHEISHKTEEGWVYEDCKVDRVIDGDTVVMRLQAEHSVKVDFGFHIKDHVVLRKEAVIIFRLADVDTPELRGDEKPEGIISKNAVEAVLNSGVSIRVVSLKEGKYGGRWIGRIYIMQETGEEIELSGWLIENELGDPYRIR